MPFFLSIGCCVIVKRIITIDVAGHNEIIHDIRTHIVLYHDHRCVETFALSFHAQANRKCVGNFLTLTYSFLIRDLGDVEKNSSVSGGVFIRHRRADWITVHVNGSTNYRRQVFVDTNNRSIGKRKSFGSACGQEWNRSYNSFHIIRYYNINQVQGTIISNYIFPFHYWCGTGTGTRNKV